MKTRNILLPNGKIISRVVHAKQCGNFCQLYVTVNKVLFAIGEGDEYLHGEPEVYNLEYCNMCDLPKQFLKTPVKYEGVYHSDMLTRIDYGKEDLRYLEYDYTIDNKFFDNVKK